MVPYQPCCLILSKFSLLFSWFVWLRWISWIACLTRTLDPPTSASQRLGLQKNNWKGLWGQASAYLLDCWGPLFCSHYRFGFDTDSDLCREFSVPGVFALTLDIGDSFCSFGTDLKSRTLTCSPNLLWFWFSMVLVSFYNTVQFEIICFCPSSPPSLPPLFLPSFLLSSLRGMLHGVRTHNSPCVSSVPTKLQRTQNSPHNFC